MIKYLRSILAIPTAYHLWWNVVGGPAEVRILVNEYVQPKIGARVLEIGCGPGTIMGYLPPSDYLGFDLSPEYVKMATRRFPKARFVCERVSEFSLAKEQSFDVVLAIGIVHHLEDAEARQLFQIAHEALKIGGKLVTMDGVWTDDQSAIARWLLARDRGEHVRSEREYMEIASQVFSNIRPSVRHDLLRIPYTHLVLECIR
jgi:cyclopropane fatty-acyl-phospholipid synthase-like methyltransferase